jgi:exopolysaccharide/PEP-CTERM locus tyrosine autokinase
VLRIAAAPQIVIDREKLRIQGFLPESTKNRQFADHYRAIKRPIIAQALGAPKPGAEDSRLVMMASALPGDGKTFTSINLAFSIAREQDVSVVLIDADVAKQHLSRIFGIEREPGLLDAVIDPARDIESLILSTSIPGLSLLPAGRQHVNATELLASMRMRQVAAQLSTTNPRRIALFDSPPLLSSSESRVLAQLLGHVVLVVRSGVTPQKAVLDAIGCVPEEKPIGLVLNGREAGRTEGYYGHEVYGAQTDDPATDL